MAHDLLKQQRCSSKTQDARVIIQGFGNVGSYLAKFLHEQGVKIVGIGDANGAIYDEVGLDIPYLLERRDSFGVVTQLFADRITNQELLERPCDILIPAALGGQITAENAGRLSCRIVIEAANGPTTAEAERMLQERGIIVVPDILANSGGVICTWSPSKGWRKRHACGAGRTKRGNTGIKTAAGALLIRAALLFRDQTRQKRLCKNG